MLNKVSIKVTFSLLLTSYLWIVFHWKSSKSSQAIWRHYAICLSWDRIGTMPSNVEQSINHLRYFRMKLFKEYCWLRTNSRRKCLKSNALFTVRSCRYDVRQVNINMLTLCFFALRLIPSACRSRRVGHQFYGCRTIRYGAPGNSFEQF